MRKLQILDAACALDDLKVPPVNRLEALAGDRKGQYSIRVNRSGVYASSGTTAKRRRLSSLTTMRDLMSTPGEILKEEFLEPLGISQYRLAKAIGKSESAVSEIVNGKRAITVEMAWLLAEALGTTPEFWMKLQTTYDLKTFDPSALPEVAALAV
ncbi:MAG: HigA family addiction module antitoxin [Atopobiaceae bacterium]|nr:HigA family addiction module antitoxin [Atopobiaceae bacterium]